MYKSVLILMCVACFSMFGFTQSSPQNSDSSEGTKEYPGISFAFPAGSWQPISKENSLVPDLYNKIQEQIDTDKKVTVVYMTAGTHSTVASLFDGVISAFSGIKWEKPEPIDPPHLISPRGQFRGIKKFNAVYRVIDSLSNMAFRLEVVIATTHDTTGNKGILYIICPESRYYDNREEIASVKAALNVDEAAASNSSGGNNTSANTQQSASK